MSCKDTIEFSGTKQPGNEMNRAFSPWIGRGCRGSRGVAPGWYESGPSVLDIRRALLGFTPNSPLHPPPRKTPLGGTLYPYVTFGVGIWA